MELTYLTKAPAGATHFIRYASGYIVWCKLEEGTNDQLVLKEWDSGNEYWVPAIHGVDFYQSIGLHSIDDFIVTMPAVDLTAAPKGATHCYNHGGQVSWYRESDSGLHVWRDGSWYTSAHKSAAELAKICPLGCIAEIVPVVGDVEAATVAAESEDEKPNTDFLARAADYHRLRDACRIMRDNPDGCTTEAVDALYKISRELLAKRKALPEWHFEFLPSRDSWAHMWFMDCAVAPSTSVMADRCVPIAEWAEQTAEHHAPSGLAVEVISTLKKTPTYFTAGELMEIHLLVDAELTKRDAAVCGGKKYLDAHWFERGELPPVGAECEAFAEGVKAEKCKIIAYHKQQVAVQWSHFNDGGLDVLSMPEWSFRPISSDRDVLLSVIVEEMNHYDTDGKLADAILAAGFKRDGGYE